MKILAAFLQQETNTFSELESNLANFEAGMLLIGGAIRSHFAGTRGDWDTVFIEATARSWELVTPLHAHAQPSGLLSRDVFEHFAKTILDAWTPDCSGALLMLHGSMAAEGVEDCEGELLRRLRLKANPATPIVVTLDPHANVTQLMADQASALVAYRTTPHVDQADTTARAIRILSTLLAEACGSRLFLARPPTVTGLDAARTIQGAGPMIEALAKAREIEELPDVLAVSLQAGFSFCDVPEAGPSVVITVRGRTASYADAAASLAGEIWRTRKRSTIRLLSLADGLAVALRPSASVGPAMLVDYSDNPGGGAPGDDVTVLQALLDADPPGSAFFSIADPAAAAACLSAGVGGQVQLLLGGKSRGAARRGPLHASGVVESLSAGRYTRRGPYFTGTSGNLGNSAMVRIGRVAVIIASGAVQTEERSQFRLFGLDPEGLSIIACKGMNHFRADFEAVAGSITFVDIGGICSPDPATRSYVRLRRPIWPLDPTALNDTSDTAEQDAAIADYSALLNVHLPYTAAAVAQFRSPADREV